jgi:hypothetical protein
MDTSAVTTAVAVADLVGEHSEAAILAQGMDHAGVFAALDGVVLSVHFHGPLPCAGEDLHRSVAGVGDYWAIALLQSDTTMLDGVQQRAVETLAARGGGWSAWCLATRGPGGELQTFGVVYRDQEAVSAGESWLNFEPAMALGLGRPTTAQLFDGWTVPEA